MKEIFGSIIFFAIISGLIWTGYQWKGESEKRAETRPSIGTLANNTNIIVENSETASSDDQADPKKEEPPKDTASNSGTQKDKVNVKVMNGGAPRGSAGRIQEFLKSSGYVGAQLGNAVGNYNGATVYYLDGNAADAESVKQTLLKEYPQIQVKMATSSKTEEGSAAVVVMLGK